MFRFDKVLLPLVACFCLSTSAQSANLLLSQIYSDSFSGRNLEIPAGNVVTIDRSIDVARLTINGTLQCSHTSAQIKANSIYVNGSFKCGSEANRFTQNLKISLKHSTSENTSGGGYRGLIVNPEGQLILFGLESRKGFVRLDRTVGPGATQLVLSDSVQEKWSVGDRIVLAPTYLYSNQAEAFSVVAISGDTVTLDSAVKFGHHGETKTYDTQFGRRTLDERAEVANLTRNILIEAEGNVDDELGGHVMVHQGGFAQLDSVELSKLGQAGILARYPFHWHMAGNVPGQFIRNSSIHDSFQRCVVVHDTNAALVSNNVCFNFKGHGFFLEDGNEVNNALISNLAIHARFPSQGKALLQSEAENGAGTLAMRFPPVASFWISHPTNVIRDNIAAGSVGTGFWNSFSGQILEGGTTPADKAKTSEFSGNIAHSSLVGMTWDGAHDGGGRARNAPLKISHYSPPQVPVFSRLVAYKNQQSGIYFRGETAIFEEAILEDNNWSVFFAYNQILRNSLVVGQYLKNTPRQREHNGVILYDGPWDLQQVDFLDFFPDKPHLHPFKTIGGANKYLNFSQGLRFDPEPKYRIYHHARTDKEKVVTWIFDFIFSNGIKDLDGSLTGLGPGYLLPDTDVTKHPGCIVPSFPISYYGMVFCPLTTQVFMLTFPTSSTLEVVKNSELTSLSSLPANYAEIMKKKGSLNSKTIIVTDPNYEPMPRYTVKLGREGGGIPNIRSDKLGIRTPPLEISLPGVLHCRGTAKMVNLAKKPVANGNGKLTRAVTLTTGAMDASCD